MTADRSLRALDIVEAVLALPAALRSEAVGRACDNDEALRAEVETLLRSDAEGAGFSEDELAAGVVAHRVLEAGAPRATGAASSDSDTWLPRSIGGYRLGAELGAGGMGIVFEANGPEGRAALKVLRPGFVSADRVRRFRRETAVLERLDHPGIARVLRAGSFVSTASEALELPYLAMELVRGHNLLDHVRARALPPPERLALLAKVAEAIAYAHDRGVIHRDLKPENVLVAADGSPKVLDFGIARVGELESFVSTFVTTTGELLGTIDYMAPELLLGERDAVTQRCDLHGLGVLCFELLTGRVPRNTRDQPLTKALRALGLEPPRPLRELLPDAPASLEALVMRCLHADPTRRLGDAGQLAKDLRAIASAWS